MFKLVLKKAEEPEIKLPTSAGSWKKQESSRKTSALSITPKLLTYCVDHNKLWKIMTETWIPDHLTCLLRNLYAGQEATVRTGHRTTDWFQIGKGGRQSYILSPYLFNLYAEYIMQNAGLDEAQAGINIAGRNINNLRYADDTTLMAESEEELKSLLMKVKKMAWNSTFIKLRSWHLSHHFMANRWGNWKQWQTIFLGSKITADGDCSHEVKRCLLLRKLWPT